MPHHSIVNESHSREHSEHSSYDSTLFAFGEWSDSKSDLLFPPGLGQPAKKNSQIWDIVQKIETPYPTPPNLDVLSLDILR